MNKPTSLSLHSLSPPQSRYALLQVTDALQSLKVLQPGYWEDLQFNNTSKLASQACGFLKKKKKKRVASQRERAREYFHWVTQRVICRTSWAELQRWWRKRPSRKKREEAANGGVLTHPPPSFCVYRDRRPPGSGKQSTVLINAVVTYAVMVKTSQLWSPVRTGCKIKFGMLECSHFPWGKTETHHHMVH